MQIHIIFQHLGGKSVIVACKIILELIIGIEFSKFSHLRFYSQNSLNYSLQILHQFSLVTT